MEPTLILLSHEEEIRKIAITVNETLFKLKVKLKNSIIIFLIFNQRFKKGYLEEKHNSEES